MRGTLATSLLGPTVRDGMAEHGIHLPETLEVSLLARCSCGRCGGQDVLVEVLTPLSDSEGPLDTVTLETSDLIVAWAS